MKYNELIVLYNNNEFRKIDNEPNSRKFYLLRSISKKKTIKKFCKKYELEENLDEILSNPDITEEIIVDFIKSEFVPKSTDEILKIETELNKISNFDWGGSMGNSLEKNIVDNYIKKLSKYEEIEKSISGGIQKSVYGYTINSWYNHWSSIMIEEIFNKNDKVLPTIDLVEKIDFFIDNVPFDLKVTYFPEELMKEKMGDKLFEIYGSKSELTCAKKIAKELKIEIPKDLNKRELLMYLRNLLSESVDERAKNFIKDVKEIKKNVITYYKENSNELIIWLYEKQGDRRFDAANRFYVVLTDSENISDSWKLKRNVDLLKTEINNKLSAFSRDKLNNISFKWKKDGKTYNCIAEILFISK